jgi:ABC-type antimicrobial peptide transport system permease subunit
LKYADELMKEYIESDQNLGRLLALVTAVAILIAIFGVYSIITLACRQRRKEIALRKIHGAKLRDILGMFVKEYGIILVISSAVAFVAGYLIMHDWLEQYVRRITVGPVFYFGIFIGTALLIALSVGSRVWRTARENPADVIKSE